MVCSMPTQSAILSLRLYVIRYNFIGIVLLSVGANQDVAYKPLPDNPNNAAKEDLEPEVSSVLRFAIESVIYDLILSNL